MVPGRSHGPADPAVVGRVVRPHGRVGELVIEPTASGVPAPAAGEEFWLGGHWRAVRAGRVDNKGRWVVRFDGVAERGAAEALRGAALSIEADELPRLGAHRFYIHELVGCRLERRDGAPMGTVVGVVAGPQDQLEVENEDGVGLVPMAKDWLFEVDTAARRIVLDPPPGLLDATRD